MRDFPFDNCPTASDLRAFLSSELDGDVLSSDATMTIARHLETCLDCARVRKDLGALVSGNQATRAAGAFTDAARELLDVQRRELTAMLNYVGRRPEVGQIWTTKYSWSSNSASNPVIAMLVVVLRVFTRPFTNAWVVDLAPVTEDLTLAAEWSLAFPAGTGVIRTPVVAHLDFQVTTTLDSLGRCLGRLSSRATKALLQALEAYDEGTSALVSVESAYFGHEAVRNRPEWGLLQHELQLMVQRFAKLLPDDDSEEFDSDSEQPFQDRTLHEALPRAPTGQVVSKSGVDRRSYEIVNSALPNEGTEDPTLRGKLREQFRIDWEGMMACLQDPQTCEPTRFLSSRCAPEAPKLFVAGCRLAPHQLPQHSAATLLGDVIVCYVFTDDARRNIAKNPTLPSAEELRSVEDLPTREILNWGSRWRERMTTVTGRTYSPSALMLFDQSLKYAQRESLKGAQLLSQAARRQDPI
jgi:hypothetical protein